jgi:hypothetical protein
MAYDVFSKKDNKIYCKAKTLEFYFRKEVIEKGKIVRVVGDTIECMGIFTVGIFDEAGNTRLGLKTFNVPSQISINFYDSEDTTITVNGEKINVLLLRYHEGDLIMSSLVPQSVINIEQFTFLLIQGALPKPLSYLEIANLWIRCFIMNKVNYKTANAVLELIIAVLCRNPSTPQEKFAPAFANGAGVFDYLAMSLRNVCKYSSVFAAITFENMSNMITTGINQTKENPEENEPSELEKIVKF